MRAVRKPVSSGRLKTIRERNLRQLLLRSSRRLNDAVAEQLALRGYDGVRAVHGLLLANLSIEGDTITALARKSNVSKQAASKLVLDLQRFGLVECRGNVDDRRAIDVRFTDHGQALLTDTMEIVQRIEDRVEAAVGELQYTHFRAVLQFVADDARAFG